MMGNKKTRPALEVGVNIDGLLRGIGLEDIADRVLELIQDGKIEIKVDINTKSKGKFPANFSVRLKRAEK